ncbi:hypothetical protein DFH06DRAFT_1247672 [Mycena polygramma]|nr:hypothetical protein DFH06DRAFT_1247672 [Mycena polygramma]
MSCPPTPLPLFRTLMLCTPCRCFVPSFPPALNYCQASKDFRDEALSNSRCKPDSQASSIPFQQDFALLASRQVPPRPRFRSTPPSVISISLSLQVSTLRQALQRTPSSSATSISSSSSIRNFASLRQAHCACVTRLVDSSCLCTLNALSPHNCCLILSTENEE